jgi:hypothetical protein
MPHTMIVFRPEQFAAVSEGVLLGQILDHLKTYFPDHCATLQHASLRAHVVDAMARARERGLTSDPHVCLFVDLVFLFGKDFDAAPWAAAILDDPSLAGRYDVQMLLLRSAAKERLAERAGT